MRRPPPAPPAAPALPAQRLTTPASTHLRDAAMLGLAGCVGWGAFTLLEDAPLAWASLAAAGVLGVARVWTGSLDARRRRIRDLLVEALVPVTGSRELDRRTVKLTKWTRGWPGVPRSIVIRYAPGAPDGDPAWRTTMVDILRRRLQVSYKIVRHDQERCRVLLERDLTIENPTTSRVERTIKELIGPTTRIRDVELGDDGEPRRVEVSHEASTRLAASGYRARVERTFSAVHPGRWRARWDLVNDRVTFELRPSFPSTIWLPPSEIDQSRDILSSYSDVAIPYGVDEDGNELAWRPAIDPNLMVVGAPGTGKALALDTPVPTPAGWTTMGQVNTGDVLFDETGAPCRVLKAHDVMVGRPCYRLRFSDGSEIVADAGHLWVTQTRSERRPRRRGRAPRMTADQLANLEQTIAAADPTELITIPEAARVAGMDQSHTILRRLADRIGATAQVPRPLAAFRFAGRVTSHPQRVLTADRAAVVAALQHPARTWESRIEPSGIASLSSGQDRVSSVELRQAMGGWTTSTAARFFRQHQLGTTHETLNTPTVRRDLFQVRRSPGGPVNAYPKTQLLRAIADWGQGTHRSSQDPVVRTTEEIAATLRHSDGHSNHSIGVCGPLQTAAAALPVDPYVLGAWLGDGTSRTGEITTVDDDMLTLIHDRGYTLLPTRRDRRRPNVMTVTVQGLRPHLDGMGLLAGTGERTGRVKRIPPEYLRASIDQRRALLAGLLDTDGTADPQGSVTFTSTSYELAAGVRELACSLGHRARLGSRRARLEGCDKGLAWSVSFTTTEDVFWLPRKAGTHRARRPRSSARVSRRYIVAVDPVESVPVRCLTVDSPTSQFLVGESFIATHNTVFEHGILAGASRYGWPIWVVDGKAIEFLGWRTWPNVQTVATTIEQQVAVIHRAWELMEYRYQLIVTGRATEDDFEPLLLFLDEFADFRANLSAWYSGVKIKGEPTKPVVLEKVASIARKGRSSRVHLLFATQRPDAEYFGGDMRDNFRARISMGRLSPQGAMMMWQDPTIGTTVPRGCRGRATTINDDNRPVEIQTFRVPDPRKVKSDDVEQSVILEALRPAQARHDRLLIMPPDLDPESGESEYRATAAAKWVLAEVHPELDPVNSSPTTAEEARQLSSPMAMFNLGGTPWERPARHLQLVRGSDAGEADAGDDGDEAVLADADLFDGYGPAVDLDPEAVTVGDLINVGSGQWATVDVEPDADLLDAECLSIGWRDDADNEGVLSVPYGSRVEVRRPVFEEGS